MRVSRYAVYCLFCLILPVFAAPATPKLRLQVVGLTGELQRNVRINLSTIDDDEVGMNGRFRARVDKAIREGLRALGYYEPTIEFELHTPKPPSRPVLKVSVQPGVPVRVQSVNILVSGDAKTDKAYQQIEARGQRAVGRILNHDRYEETKKQLTSLAWRKGYFDAQMIKSQLGVIPQQEAAFWDIEFDSGVRYRFGQADFSGSQIDDEYLRNLQPFQSEGFYDSEQLGEFNRRLAATGWFSAALMAPDFSNVGQDKTLPLKGEIVPRARHALESGVGYSTDIGPKVTGTWRRPWLNAYGHSLNTTLSLSAPEQSLETSYRIPLVKNALEHYYLVQAGYKRENLNNTQADSSSLNVARFWHLDNDWQRALNLRWSYDHFTQATQTTSTMLLYPGLMFRRTRQDGSVMPMWGDTQNYSIDVSNQIWGSGVNFETFQLQNVWIRSLSRQHRFVARGNVGWIETDDFAQVPPSLRFFAGGDRSIRGYKFKSISPVDNEGKLLGASKLATASLEYQYNIQGRWWGALFVDSGQATNSFRDRDLKTGAGIGLRWVSPVGPIKLDFAVPVGDSEKKGLQFYIGLGPEL